MLRNITSAKSSDANSKQYAHRHLLNLYVAILCDKTYLLRVRLTSSFINSSTEVLSLKYRKQEKAMLKELINF